MSLRLEPLADQRLDTFTCGQPALDEWLHHHAHTATGHGTRTWILTDEHEAVLGYFAIAPHLLVAADAPSAIRRGAPRQIPAVLLAKLAVDRSAQGTGLGAELLVHALQTILDAARIAGGRVVIVDALDEAAAAFYRRHDFQPLPGNDHRLVMKLTTAARALGQPWP